MAERWLVVSNCQTFGLTNCLQTLARDVEVVGQDYWAYTRSLEGEPEAFADYDLALLMYACNQHPAFRDNLFKRHRPIPIIEFGGYHPDCCYVLLDGALLDGGVIGPYHSLIVLAAYQQGLDVSRTLPWFRSEVYEQLGYFDQWPLQREMLVSGVADLGLDVTPVFRAAGRGRTFMHTFDHPDIAALYELARTILQTERQPVFEHVPPPPDNLADTRWPVYPEVGERLGVAGSYLFTPLRKHKPIALPEYVERSLAFFSQWSPDRLTCQPTLAPRLATLRAMMREG